MYKRQDHFRREQLEAIYYAVQADNAAEIDRAIQEAASGPWFLDAKDLETSFLNYLRVQQSEYLDTRSRAQKAAHPAGEEEAGALPPLKLTEAEVLRLRGQIQYAMTMDKAVRSDKPSRYIKELVRISNQHGLRKSVGAIKQDYRRILAARKLAELLREKKIRDAIEK